MLKEAGYTIRDACKALGISRKSFTLPKKISLRSRAAEWKEAIEMAIMREFPEGVRGRGLKLIREDGSQPRGASFVRDMVEFGIG